MAKMSKGGEITLPRQALKELGWTPGLLLSVERIEDCVVLRRYPTDTETSKPGESRAGIAPRRPDLGSTRRD